MFYDQYILLCERKGKRPYEAAREIGFGTSNVAQWKKGSTPRKESLEQIAEYFGVSVGYLIDGEQKEKPTVKDDRPGANIEDWIVQMEKWSDADLAVVMAKMAEVLKKRGESK